MNKEQIGQMIAESLAQKMNGHADEEKPRQSLDIQARVLADMVPEINRPNPFKVGDLVKQKGGGTAYRWPAKDQLAIVTHVWTGDEAKLQRPRPNKPFSREDIVILVLADGDRWCEYSAESWRFEKYEGEVA